MDKRFYQDFLLEQELFEEKSIFVQEEIKARKENSISSQEEPIVIQEKNKAQEEEEFTMVQEETKEENEKKLNQNPPWTLSYLLFLKFTHSCSFHCPNLEFKVNITKQTLFSFSMSKIRYEALYGIFSLSACYTLFGT